MRSRTNFLLNMHWVLVMLVASWFSPQTSASVKAQQSICSRADESVSQSLIDLGNSFYTRMDGTKTSYTGGLYPEGKNNPPAQLAATALKFATNIQPRNKNGDPDAEQGKIVLISVGMSNTDAEFIKFQELANQDPEIIQPVVLINGALGGQTAEFWTDLEAATWQELNRRLDQAGLAPLQVQAAWVKQTHRKGGDFPEKALELQTDLETIARNLKKVFPNLQIAYFSSRTRSYNLNRGLSPEPYAFETGFSVKWMIEKQISRDPSLNYDARDGEVVAPLLLWGPYLWIDGDNPRSDGRVWLAEDLAEDCTHPSSGGTEKVAEMLLEFFKRDPSARPWFLAGEGLQTSPTRQIRQAQSSALPTAMTSTAPKVSPTAAQNAYTGPITPPPKMVTPAPSEVQTTSQENQIWLIIPVLLLAGGLLGIWHWKRQTKRPRIPH